MYKHIAETVRNEITALTPAANHRAWLHVWTSLYEIANSVWQDKKFLDDNPLPKTHGPGTTAAMHFINPKTFACAYTNVVIASEHSLKQQHHVSVLTNLVRRSTTVAHGARHQICRFQISQKQAERRDAAWRQSSRVSIF